MSEPILYFKGYSDALSEVEMHVRHAKNLLDVKAPTSPAGWQDAAFEYVLNVIHGKQNDVSNIMDTPATKRSEEGEGK